MSTIPYTHWAYFPSPGMADRCRRELSEYVTRLRAPNEEVGPQWLLLAGRDVEVADLVERHAEVEAIVVRHGGTYDGGEATYLDGIPVVDPMLTDRSVDG